MRISKKLFTGAALALVSAVVFATTTYTVTFVNDPYFYQKDTYGTCYWKFTTASGGTWGSQFLYVPAAGSGSCPYSSMQVNHSPGAYYANVVLN